MSVPARRPSRALSALERLAESGGLDELAWALTRVALAAAQDLAPEAKTPAEAAWVVARRADPSLEPPTAERRSRRARRRAREPASISDPAPAAIGPPSPESETPSAATESGSKQEVHPDVRPDNTPDIPL